MDGVYATPLNDEFRFVHEPLSGVIREHHRRFVGREDELSELASRIVLSDGGATSRQLRRPAALLCELNRQILSLGLEARFAVMFYGVLDAAARRFDYSNAGPVEPLLRRRRGVFALEATGVPLGLFADAAYDDRHVDLEPGDAIVGFTADAVEAEHSDGREFNESTIRELLAPLEFSTDDDGTGGAAGALATAVLDARVSFGPGESLIALALTYRGKGNA